MKHIKINLTTTPDYLFTTATALVVTTSTGQTRLPIDRNRKSLRITHPGGSIRIVKRRK